MMKKKFWILALVAFCATTLWTQARSLVALDYTGGQTLEISMHLDKPIGEVVDGSWLGKVTDEMIETMGIELYLGSDEQGRLVNIGGGREYNFHSVGVPKPGGKSFIISNVGTTLRGDGVTIDLGPGLNCRITPFLVLKGQKELCFFNTEQVWVMLNGKELPQSTKYPNNPMLQLVDDSVKAPTTTSFVPLLPPYVLFKRVDGKLSATINLNNLPGINLIKMKGVLISGERISYPAATNGNAITTISWVPEEKDSYSLFVGSQYIDKNLIPAYPGDGVKEVLIVDERWVIK